MKKVYLETYGCQMNVSDSERVATQLVSNGFEIVAEQTDADVVLLNTCSVREKAEQKLYTRVGQIRAAAPPPPVNSKTGGAPLIGVMGCVAQLEGESIFARRAAASSGNNNGGIDFIVGTKAVGRIISTIEKALDGRRNFVDLGKRDDDYEWTVSPAQRQSPHVAFVPIIEGCNKFCTYCIVPFSRGREKSLPAAEILREVELLKNQNVREVHLIGQNVNSYRPSSDAGLESFRGATAFSRLLRAVAVTGIERVKFTTSFPRDFHPDIVDAIDEHENLCNWVHLPVQSGSNEVLKAMRRGHTIESYLEKIDKINSSHKDIAVSSDIIVGFPGETDKNFKDTLKMAEYCRFDSAYIFKYSPRLETPAARMENQISESVKTERFLELEKIVRKSQEAALKKHLGATLEVLAERVSSKNIDELSGHTTCHKIVNFKATGVLPGSVVPVRITAAKTNTLYGEAIG
ncbi:MAG: tRNA (N6-isopentenyl adenosine(37)-C2)-methylthiotransferase MiaB [Acidobacteria bacterium]|jgi:tRNA-2-methylthio-N6-dimethylallyladenosine synthase|nr:tRNA (N6-isopentenyl adenosine(37)-C2)-methylthiotransferase MiaB [Acidobacteriota bacterium]